MVSGMGSSFLGLGGLQDRSSHSNVGSATAKVAAESLFHLFISGVGMAVQEILRGHHKARRTIPALLAVVLHERRGDRMHLGIGSETFDGLNALALDRKSTRLNSSHLGSS